MTRTNRIPLSAAIGVLALLAIGAIMAVARAQGRPADTPPAAQGTVGAAFTYQGQLQKDGEPVDQPCQMVFRLYDAAGSGGDPVGSPITATVPVTDGLFTVLLNQGGEFGPAAFAGEARWLGLRVLCPGDAGYADLGRQELTAAPYAHYALSAGALQGSPVTTTQPAAGQVLKWDGAAWGPADESGLLPPGAMVLGRYSDTALLDAGFSLSLRSLDGWDMKRLVPTGRYLLGAAAVDDRIYAIGGVAGGATYATANEVYDPAASSWLIRAPMPTGRHSLAVAALDGVIYAIGGSSAITACETTVEAYYPLSDTWVTKAPLPTGRANLAAAAADGMIYAIGGSCSNTYETTVEAYDPATDSWIARMPLPTGRRYLAAAALDDLIYAIGGSSAANQFEPVVELYYPITNTWVVRAPLPTGRYGLAAAAADGAIHAVGGRTSADYSSIHEVYDPTFDAWDTRIPLLAPRIFLAAAAVDASLYAIGGTTSSNERDLNEVYHPPLYVYVKD